MISKAYYGSRARGEASVKSDVDLILAEEGDDIKSPMIVSGLSVHRYSKGWLLKGARDGSLFVYHVAFEGVSLCGGDELLLELRKSFKKKTSYSDERLEALLILRFLLESDWCSKQDIQQRYFWAIRTIVVCFSADNGRPCFASSCLESLSGIDGLAAHIDRRATETYADCLRIGGQIEKRFGADMDCSLSGGQLRNYLVNRGGVARDTVHLVEDSYLSELGVNITYM